MIALPEGGTEHFDFVIKQRALFFVSRIALLVEFGGPVQHPAAQRIDAFL